MKKGKITFLLLISFLLGCISTYYYFNLRPKKIDAEKILDPHKMTVSYPQDKTINENKFTCHSIIGTSMFTDINEWLSKDDDRFVKASLNKDRYTFNIEIVGDRLKFDLPEREAIMIGYSEKNDWSIVKNNSDDLFAISSSLNTEREDMYTFMLNKKVGKAVFKTSENDKVVTKSPQSFSFYLACE